MRAVNVDPAARPPAPGHLTITDVLTAAGRLLGVATRTPVITSQVLDERLGARVHLKAECLQRVGAFKFRGAYNAVSSLSDEERARGVCTASSGNHAQAVALAARLLGARATILMPGDAPAIKRAATEGHGAEVIEFDRYTEDRETLLRALAAERDLVVVHPYDDPRVMAGQGTLALELLEQIAPAPALDVLVVPVGGGGLASGCATVIREFSPDARIVGVEPEASDDLARSIAAGRRERVTVAPTIADGQQTRSPGELTWPVLHALLDETVTVTDEQLRAAMRFCFTHPKLVVEPSGACALAALLAGCIPDIAGATIGVVLSGGNVDPTLFATTIADGR